MNNITEVWAELNKIVESYVEEDMTFNTAFKKITDLNDNKFGIEINAHAVLDREEMNEEDLISYDEESYEDSYDEDEED